MRNGKNFEFDYYTIFYMRSETDCKSTTELNVSQFTQTHEKQFAFRNIRPKQRKLDTQYGMEKSNF